MTTPAMPNPQPMPDDTGREAASELPLLRSLVVKKLCYAANPWRVVEPRSGRQVYGWREATLSDGRVMPFRGPVCFPRKRDAEAWLAERIADAEKEVARG